MLRWCKNLETIVTYVTYRALRNGHVIPHAYSRTLRAPCILPPGSTSREDNVVRHGPRSGRVGGDNIVLTNYPAWRSGGPSFAVEEQ